MTHDSDAHADGQAAPTSQARRGRARVLVLLLVAALAALAVLLWTLRTRLEPMPPAAAPRGEAPAQGIQALESPAPRFDIGNPAASEAPRERTPLERRPRVDERQRFAGSGVLEGRLSLPQGVAAPRAWSLVLAPSPVLIGGDRARGRRLEFHEGELEFSLADVPLGGYEIWAEADGMSGRHEHLLLARPDALLVYQDLRLVPLAIVRGRVFDVEGVGVAGLPVILRAQSGSARLEARADGGGNYLFQRVPDGEYLVEVGFADASLAAPLELAVLSPSLHVPPIEVPRLFELTVLVRDPDGLPLPGARVRGWCNHGGRIDAESDAAGLARQPWIPAGRVTLEAALAGRPDVGFARVHLDFPAPGGAPLEIRLQR